MRLGRRALVTGTQVNYYYVCPTKLWLFSHGIRMEPESDLVMEGRLLHERGFPGRRKDVIVDDRISVDFLETRDGLVLHEVKRSRSFGRAAEMQLLYYLYYLRGKGVDVRRGILHFMSSREVEEVELTEDAEREVEDALRGIGEIVSMRAPPPPARRGYCRRCAYRDLCWS